MYGGLGSDSPTPSYSSILGCGQRWKYVGGYHVQALGLRSVLFFDQNQGWEK